MDGLSRRVDGGRRGQCFAVGVHARLKKTDFSDGNILYGVWGVGSDQDVYLF